MRRTPFLGWTTAIVAALLFGLSPAIRAQEEDNEGEKIQEMLQQAMEHMTAAGGLMEKAKSAPAADADKAKAEASTRWDQACEVYGQILERLQNLSGNEEAKAEVRGLCHYNTACARALQGRKDEAITAFGASLDDGFDDWDHIAKDTDLDSIRKEPRFIQLVERAKAAAGAEALSPNAMFPYELGVTTIDGQTINLADLRGKVVIVDYWGTWCPPCKAEIPHFAQLKQELGDKLVIVGMTWENGEGGPETVEKLKKFAQENNMTWPLVLLTDRTAFQKVPDFRGQFPTTLFIDKQGRVRAKEIGLQDLDTLRAIVQALDAEPAPTAPAPAPSGGTGGTPF